jgi:2-hydroxy-4-carboxymuconate semialdehyde hemiacetal dehydrogenase
MTETIKVALAGAGAFGIKHLDGIKNIDGVEVVSLIGRELDKTREVAAKYGIGHVTTDLADSLALPEVDAVILCTPTQMHASQTLACLRAGKHVQVEIPLCDVLADGEEAVPRGRGQTGLVAMCGHTRRFNPSHQWVHHKITAGEFNIQQMDVQTYFFRRTNMNALGQPRSWTDHLLWHHAAHTVDLFAYQCGSPIVQANAIQGPIHPALGIAMDMSIQLKAANGAICTLSLSFNNDGPLGTFFRYIGDTGTYIARYDDLFNGKDEKIDVSQVDVSMNGIELQDREFFAAIREGREPNSSVAQVLPCYQVLHELERQLALAGKFTVGAPDEQLHAVLQAMLVMTLFASYVCSAMAMRHYGHASFIMSMPVSSPERVTFTPAAVTHVHRAGLLYSWGLRLFLMAAPLVAGIVHPAAMPVVTVLLLVALHFFDQPALLDVE